MGLDVEMDRLKYSRVMRLKYLDPAAAKFPHFAPYEEDIAFASLQRSVR